MAGARIQGKEYPIQDILCEKFVFAIPRYQRPYAWKVEQVQTLLDDLLSAMGNLDDDSDDIDSYFMGSVVVVKEEDKPGAEVVDGQQRITTLTILLAAIRARLSNGEERDEITKFIYHKGSKFTKMPDHFHLTLREKDAEFFRDKIQRDISMEEIQTIDLSQLETDSQRNIALNARKYLEMLAPLSQRQLGKLATYILTQCYLIIVSTPNVDSAYRIFSVLNDRGLDLSHSDIFKAELIGKIDDQYQDSYASRWENAEEQIGRDAFKDLFAHIRMIHRKVKMQETILKEVRQHVLPQYDPRDFIDKVVVPLTEAFDVLQTSSYESVEQAEEVNDILKWLRRIDNVDWIPPALVYYRSYHNDPAALLKFYTDLERLAASMMVRRYNINYRIEGYGQLLAAIERGDDLYQPHSPLQLSEEDIQDTLSRLDGDIYNSGARLYILRRLDAELSETKTTPSLPIITIEHVLPQNPDEKSQWFQWYPDPEVQKAWVHRLGNLALLSRRKNSQARNFEFERKKGYYFNTPVTPFALTTQIIKQATWEQKILEQQHKENLDALVKLWRLQ